MKLETAKRLYEYRKASGLSQEQVAARIGVSRQAVSKWECAESSPDTDNLIALAVLYGVTVDELLFADPENMTFGASRTKESGLGRSSAEDSAGFSAAAAGGRVPGQAGVSDDVDPGTSEAADGEAAYVDVNAHAAFESRAEGNGTDGFDGSEDYASGGTWQRPDNPDEDYVDVSFTRGVHVRDSKSGEEVHVGWDGIHVDNDKEHVHLDFGFLARMIREFRKDQP
ncbi:helix-turn-helix transcriptional regulator [Actinobaculum sp. 313]|uniref:helix-turn-helix domain-containing protein n=1 Tax=Actinobaculum sp. 313 TaxID=2495645 RepID=UPI000D5296CF|nr:helix-turn-helix transcriptional regulator [Actinobaculum sp. 313]AWE42095.1 XRE family transcriptional regulator [Actinobaculum sp. 313]